MHDLKSVAMICANTTRSRAYLQNMTRRGLRPEHVLVLDSPGRVKVGQSRAWLDDQPQSVAQDHLWQTHYFNPNSALFDDLAAIGTTSSRVAGMDINSSDVISALTKMSQSTVIYSGFGGQILRSEVLSLGKKFLHVHGGYLPKYRGSTTNYFSLLSGEGLGASAIFLTQTIDAGPILMRRKFHAPPDRRHLDHLHDSAARAAVLCDVLDHYGNSGVWPLDDVDPDRHAQTFYVIHPVLKHLAVYHAKGPE